MLLAIAVDAGAQERGPVVLRLPASTRALAMGNVFGVGSVDSDGIFYHAAFPDRLRGVSLGVQWWGSRASLYTASGATEWWGGGLAVGVRSLDYGGRLSAPIPAGPRTDEGTLDEPGVAVISERAASVAYARRIKGVRAAVTTHLIEQRVIGERNVAAAFDAGLGLETTYFGFALSGRNIGSSFERAGEDVALPTQVQLTVAAIRAGPLGPIDVQPGVAVLYELDGDVVPAGGVEVSYWPVSGRTFSLRLGARRADDGVRPWTAGAGFSGDRLILDYAVVPLTGDRVIHRFGIRWR